MALSRVNQKIGTWLRRKRNFYLFSVATMGLGSWLLLVWNLGHAGDAYWIAFLAVLAVVLSLAWAFFMWRFFHNRFGKGPDAT